MSKQSEFTVQEQFVEQKEAGGPQPDVAPRRLEFVEPEISLPVDVLEATTFFQSATSGITN